MSTNFGSATSAYVRTALSRISGLRLRHAGWFFLSCMLSTTSVGDARAEHWTAVVPGGTPVVTGSDPCAMAIISAYISHTPNWNSWLHDFLGCGVTPSIAGSNWSWGGSGFAEPTCDAGETHTDAGCIAGNPQNNQKICRADPVDVLSGQLYETAIDYQSAGPDPLIFQRYYSNNGNPFSIFSQKSRFGVGGWKSNFDAPFMNSGGYIYIALPWGTNLAFQYVSGAYVPVYFGPSGPGLGQLSVREVLTPDGSGGYDLTLENGTVYDFSGSVYGPTGINYLNQIRYRGGYTQTLSYNSNGLNTSVTDNRGRTLTFVNTPSGWPTVGSLSSIMIGGTTIASYAYVGKTDVAAITALIATYAPGAPIYPGMEYARYTLQSVNFPSQLGADLTYLYTDAHNPFALTGIQDENGINFTTWAYDATTGRVISNQRSGPVAQYSFAFDPTHAKVTSTNPLGRQEIINYTAAPQGSILPGITSEPATANAPASSHSAQFDATQFLSQTTDAEGRVTTYANDSVGEPLTVIRGAGTPSAATTTQTWNSQWRAPSQIVETGVTTDNVWDTVGKLTSVTKTDTTTQTVPYSTNGQTRVWTYNYDTTGLLTSSVDPAGKTIAYTYNGTGSIQTITDQLGHVTTVTAWNVRGQPTSITDTNGVVTAITYETVRGLPTQVSVDTAGTPATTTIVYDAVGDITKITDPIGAWTSFTYDNARRLTGLSNVAGESIAYVRDAMGDATSVTVKNSGGATVFAKSQVFDELARLIKSIGASSQTYAFGYDKTNNPTSVTDPVSHVFSQGFDALSRLISQTNEDSVTVTLTRNPTDHITSYQDPRTLTTTYVRNGFGEVIQEVSPDRGATTYWRDARGLITQRTDARGVTLNYTYDAAGRIKGEQNYANANDNVWYAYDQPATGSYPIGRLTTVYDVSGQLQRFYDQKGYIWQESRLTGTAPWISTVFVHDLAGNLTEMFLPSGRHIVWNRDAMGRVTQVALQGGTGFPSWVNVANPIVNNPYGGPSSLTFGNGLVETYGVDTDYHVTSVKLAPSSGPALIDRTLAWTGEELNSITDAVTSGNSETFTYTPSHRLATAHGAYGSLAWTYDAVGDRATQVVGSTTQTYTYPSTSNKLASITQTGATTRSFGYDASGNRSSDTVGPSVLNAQYDGHGHLRTFQTGSTTDGTYAYDGFARIVQRVVSSGGPSGTTQYLYDEFGHVVVETDGAGASLREYLWLGDMPIAIIDQVNTASPVLYYVHADHLDRPIMVTNAAKASVWQAVWTPFGAPQSITGALTYNARFPGQWFQIENGLNYNWNRHYDPSTGRYLQPDPFSAEMRDQTQAGVLSGTPTPGAFAGNLVHGFNEALARAALADVNAAIGSPAFPIAPGTTADLFAQFGDLTKGNVPANVVFPDGPAIYTYVRNSPQVHTDLPGLAPKDKRFGLPSAFWHWYHRCVKQPGDADLEYEGACELHDYWCSIGKPSGP